jgi:hypothetical protein
MPEVQVSGTNTSEIEVRTLIGPFAEYWFVFNHSNNAADLTFSVAKPAIRGQLVDVTTREKISVNAMPPLPDERWVFSKKLGPNEVWIIKSSVFRGNQVR